MKWVSYLNIGQRMLRLGLCVLLVLAVSSLALFSPRELRRVSAAPPQQPEETQVVFFNPAGITVADRVSNNAGTNPGLPAAYPSNLVVSGLSGTITKVTVAFQTTSTFPDDLDILLVGPTGAHTLIMSDAGGIEDLVGVGFIWDQTAASFMPDNPVTAVPTGIYKPSNYAGNPTPEPGGMDNFPAPGPGLLNYPTDLNVFNGTTPNGTWKLFVVDDAVGDLNSLPSGWSLDITTGGPCTAAKRPLDMNGDGKTDYTVVRDLGGLNWFTLINGGPFIATQWGIGIDTFTPADYDGDGKTDIAVWRFGAQSFFYILQSATGTLRSVPFGNASDEPRIIGDYDGDGKADPAVYRNGQGGNPSVWYFLSSINGSLQSTIWGQAGDVRVPGDWDGDGKYDFAVKRNVGGQAVFFRKFSGGGSDAFAFGLFAQDRTVPGYYDDDCKQDIAVVRDSGMGQTFQWFILNSTNQSLRSVPFGTGGTDRSCQGDYDGDGRTDICVWRDTTIPNQQAIFFFIRSSDNTLGVLPWGLTGDIPAAFFNNH